jgi:predicted KAP-like P-loop ATPase
MAKPKRPVKKPTQRALAVVATHQAGVAKLLELMAEEIGEGGRAARLASKARMSGDPELRALVDRLQGWRDEDFANWQREMAEPPRPPR